MPVVPFSAAAGGRSSAEGRAKPIAIPAADEPWLLMAAATMDAQGRLIEPTPPAEVPSDGA
jgi:hypothetical protein